MSCATAAQGGRNRNDSAPAGDSRSVPPCCKSSAGLGACCARSRARHCAPCNRTDRHRHRSRALRGTTTELSSSMATPVWRENLHADLAFRGVVTSSSGVRHDASATSRDHVSISPDLWHSSLSRQSWKPGRVGDFLGFGGGSTLHAFQNDTLVWACSGHSHFRRIPTPGTVSVSCGSSRNDGAQWVDAIQVRETRATLPSTARRQARPRQKCGTDATWAGACHCASPESPSWCAA